MDYLHVQADNPWYNYYLCSTAGCVMLLYISRGVTVLLGIVCEREVVLVWAGKQVSSVI